MRRWSERISILFFATLLVVAQTLPIRAQSTGQIAGTVVDAESGEKLEFVQLYIQALNIGAMSDEEGRFHIQDVPPGTHELKAELIGYTGLVETVTIAAEQTVTVALQMAPSALFLDEVVVTGTAFKESPISLTYAVAVVGRDKMKEQGSPQATDFFKNISASHGVIGERNSWYNSNQAATLAESVANVNLRGLGASRTLVLINGQRQVYVPARLIGGRFVDVNAIPSIAIDRIEVLKEGASAIYGSDAVAGVANFLTRSDFKGFEISGAYDHIANAGDANLGAIWGGKLGKSHAVISAEWLNRRELGVRDRDYLLQPWYQGGQRMGWSSLGNPGTFAVGSPQPWTATIHAPRCEDFGGFRESWTCRFRYQPWDNLIEGTRHARAFAEINGSLDNGTNYHIEGLWAQAEIPNWYTTPSYPPFPITDTNTMEVAPDHPGRRAFCDEFGDEYDEACAGDENWYFNGRPFGNSGPERILSRNSNTWRVAASADGDFKATHFDLGLSYSRSSGDLSFPGVYIERMFLAFRGFGGPDCGVGVIARDPDDEDYATKKMRLGPLNGATPGAGNCMYYNPFSNAIEYSQQPGARFETERNPSYRANLANSEALRQWLNEEVGVSSTADMLVADATLTGALHKNVWLDASYAVGYQFRRLNATGDPDDVADVTLNPCPVVGDQNCSAEDKFGPYLFTNVHRPYSADQTVHRFFGEIPLSLGERFDVQLAGNYEFHNFASSFDPKFGWRLQLSQSETHSLFVRGSVQTTFRTPSLDDVNETPLTTLEWINQTGAYQAVDRFGSPDLKPEQAFTYNAGLSLATEAGFDATLDYWSYDFSDVIGAMPYGKIVDLYESDATKDAVRQFIVCPDGVGTGTCGASALERVQIDLVNWPGVKTSGLDFHLGARIPAGTGHLAASLDATYTFNYRTKALMLNNLVLQDAADAAGYLNFGNPIATSIPKLKGQASAGYHWKNYSLVSYLNYISSYEDRGSMASSNRVIQDLFSTIDPFITWDVSLLWTLSKRINFALSGVNLLDTRPPMANVEQAYDGFTHTPKGRKLKLAITYQLAD